MLASGLSAYDTSRSGAHQGRKRWYERAPSGAEEAGYIGRTGVAMAWAHLAEATGEGELIGNCRANAEVLMREDPGPVTDFFGGASGNGLFLLRLWRATGEAR